MKHRGTMRAAGVMVAAVLVASLAGIASAKHFSEWGSPVNAEAVTGASAEVNTSLNDGCPIESPDGRSLYIASNRAEDSADRTSGLPSVRPGTIPGGRRTTSASP
jgi:hypothetical protein